jgi:hypothetical protein
MDQGKIRGALSPKLAVPVLCASVVVVLLLIIGRYTVTVVLGSARIELVPK